MKDIMQKLAELEATAPKVTKKKMLNEDSTTPPMNVSNKPASLKDVFASLSENIAPGQKPIPVLDPQNKQAGMGFVTSDNPSIQNILKGLDPKEVQIVQAPGQQPVGQQQQRTGQSAQPAQAGATGQSMQAGQQTMQEESFSGGSKEDLAKEMYFVASKIIGYENRSARVPENFWQQYNNLRATWEKTYGELDSKDIINDAFHLGEYVHWVKDKGAQQKAELGDKLTYQVRQDEGGKWIVFDTQFNKPYSPGKDDKNKVEILAAKLNSTQPKQSAPAAPAQPQQKSFMGRMADKAKQAVGMKEGAKVDRMVKHIEKSEKKLGKSKGEAEDIAWATANKRGMLDNKNKKKTESVSEGSGPKEKQKKPYVDYFSPEGREKTKAAFDTAKAKLDQDKKAKEAEKIGNKKVKEGDIAPTSSIDTRGAGLGAGRSRTTLEGKKPDFLDLDKDGNKKEPMKKAAADKKKKKVDESMNHRISAARLEGKSHGLRGHAHSGKRYEDLDEMKAYHEGYKEGLDECYGQGVYETAMPATVPGMASAAMEDNYSLTAPTLSNKDGHITTKLPSQKNPFDTGSAAPASSKPWIDTTFRDKTGEIQQMFGSEEASRLIKSGLLTPDTRLTVHEPSGPYKARMVVAKDFEQLAGLFGMDEGIRDNLKKAGMAAALGATALGAGGMAKGAYDYHHKEVPGMGMSQSDVDKTFGHDPAAGRKSYFGTNTNEAEFDEGNAFTAALAKTPKGGKFSVGGKTFTDRTNYDTKVDEYAFEAWDRELSNLLNEGTEVNEGLSVSISKGQQNSPDSVTITAQDQEAEHLLAFVKNAGLGLFGDDHEHSPSSAMSIQPAHGAPDEVGAGGVDIGVVDGHDGMMGLMQKLSGIQAGGDEDYADEEGDEEQLYGNHAAADEKDCGCDGDCECSDYDKPSKEESCNECGGMMEAGHSCGSKEMVDEVESEDQMEFEVAEDNAPDSGAAETTADENAEAEEDKALALKSVNESFADILARFEKLAEGSGDEPKHAEHDKKDDKDNDDAEEEEVTESKDEDENPEEDGPDHGKAWSDTSDELKEEELTEWANNAGKKGTDAAFEADIDFMTKVIAGGLNKPKSTGQTTVPVIAGQESRMHDHQGTVSDSIDDWTKLAGIK